MLPAGEILDSAAINANDILEQLDQCTDDFVFPMLDNGYVYPITVRMNGYSDGVRWALIIEVVGHNVRAGGHDGVSNCLHSFGNCLGREPGTCNDDFISISDDGPDGPTFDDEFGYVVRQDVKSICVRAKVVPVDLHLAALDENGLLKQDETIAADLFRSLLPSHREEFLATEDELRRFIPLDLPLILRLDEWHHPDLANGHYPSQSETFRLVAKVLASADMSHYKPTKKPNTHWSNWPEGGTL